MSSNNTINTGTAVPVLPKAQKSKKLFYGKYLFKVTFESELLRNINLTSKEVRQAFRAVNHLRSLSTDPTLDLIAIPGSYLHASLKEFNDAIKISKILENYSTVEVKARSDYGCTSYFTNSEQLLDTLLIELGHRVLNYAKPESADATAALMSGKEIELVADDTYKFKAYLTSRLGGDALKELKEFTKTMPHLVKPVSQRSSSSPSYVLLKTEKSATLFELRFANVVRKLVKLVKLEQAEALDTK